MSKEAINDIINYLINDGKNKEMQWCVEESRLKKKREDLKRSINISNIIDQKYINESPLKNFNLENSFSLLENKFEKISGEISSKMIEKLNLQKRIREYNWNCTNIAKIEKISKEISKEINGTNINLWDLICDLNMMLPSMSVEEISSCENKVENLKLKIESLKKESEAILQCISDIPLKEKIELRKMEIKELLLCSNCKESLQDINKELEYIKSQISEAKAKITKRKIEFNGMINNTMKSLEIQKSDTGVGQQIPRIIKMLKYQEAACMPVLLDGFMDGGTYENKRKIFEYIEKNSKHQIIICCTINNENDEFLKYLKNKNVKLIEVTR